MEKPQVFKALLTSTWAYAVKKAEMAKHREKWKAFGLQSVANPFMGKCSKNSRKAADMAKDREKWKSRSFPAAPETSNKRRR